MTTYSGAEQSGTSYTDVVCGRALICRQQSWGGSAPWVWQSNFCTQLLKFWGQQPPPKSE